MMTQENIGKFIAEKRKEKNMTQEQFAEKLGVSNRSVSRWENGKTMPDYSLFPPICETLGIRTVELLEGKKYEDEDHLKEQLHLIVELIDYEKQKKQKIINRYMIIGITCFVMILLHNQFHLLKFAPKVDFLVAILTGLGIVCICSVLYHNNQRQKYTEDEMKAFLGVNQDIGMRTAGEMLQYAKRIQKAELKQYGKAFQAIEEKLQPEENVIFSMVADTFVVNEMWADSWKPWHTSFAVTGTRLLVCGEAIRGRFMTFYDVESFALEDIVSVELINRKIVIKFTNQMLTIEGKELEMVIEHFKNALKVNNCSK